MIHLLTPVGQHKDIYTVNPVLRGHFCDKEKVAL